MSLKGNIFALISIYLFITNLSIFSRIQLKQLILIFLLIIIAFLLISFENSSANDKNILDVQSGATYRDNYDNKAPVKIIYNINLYNLVTSPIKNYHADSFLETGPPLQQNLSLTYCSQTNPFCSILPIAHYSKCNYM